LNSHSKERDDSKEIYNIVKGIRNLYMLKSSALKFAVNDSKSLFDTRKTSWNILPKRSLFIHKGEILNETNIFERKESESSIRNNTNGKIHIDWILTLI